jgi:hypothetical protein
VAPTPSRIWPYPAKAVTTANTLTQKRETNQAAPLYNPRKDSWQQHFTWSEDYTLILGLTPTGRATVELLQLNRLGNQNLRQVLYVTGYHPPKL